MLTGVSLRANRSAMGRMGGSEGTGGITSGTTASESFLLRERVLRRKNRFFLVEDSERLPASDSSPGVEGLLDFLSFFGVAGLAPLLEPLLVTRPNSSYVTSADGFFGVELVRAREKRLGMKK